MRTEFSSEKEKHNYFNRMTQEQKLDAMGEILACSRHVAFLGGAGVSTESGIPDFRSKNGLYRKKEKSFAKCKPEYLLSYDCLHKKPEVFFSYYRKNLDARRAEPNAAHFKLAELEQTGRLEGVITQNIDGKPAAKMSMRSTGPSAPTTAYPAAGSTGKISFSRAPKRSRPVPPVGNWSVPMSPCMENSSRKKPTRAPLI